MRNHLRILALVIPAALVALACDSAATKEEASKPEPVAVPASATAASARTAALAAPAFIVAPTHRPSGKLEFKPALDLEQSPKPGEPQLRGGQVAASKDWPASLYATFTTSEGIFACTAALIGPEVMLTAAHCVPPNGVVTFKYKGHPKDYTASCDQHPRYSQDASADFALCKVKPAFAAPAWFQYEMVSTSAMTNQLNKTITLTGFGCISEIVSQDNQDGKYRFGFNTIDETSKSTSRRRGAQYYTGQENNNMFTTDDPKLANLCPGDSGGPAFGRTGGLGQVTSREIVGVNSRVFFADETKTSYGSSLISATGGPDFGTWFKQWALDQGVKACGTKTPPPNCRG
jgi:hypothetical protein